MKTEELIVRIAADAAPVRRLPSIAERLGGWLLVALPVVAVFVAVVGPRADLATRVVAPAFLISVLLVTSLAIVCARAALLSSVPGHERALLTVLGPLLILVWAAALFARLAAGGSVGAQLFSEPSHTACVLQISLMAVLPAIVLWRLVGAGAPVAPGWSGMLTLAASFGAGAVGSAVICPIDRAAHEALWHLLPVASLAAAGALIGRAWLVRLRL